jgi:hypothetical protein
VDAHSAENTISGVDRGQSVACRVHQRQKPLITIGHLLRQVLVRVERGEQAAGGRPETAGSGLHPIPHRGRNTGSIVGDRLAAGRRMAHDA